MAVPRDAYRPPWILIIGLPVRVIDTSSLNPLRCINGAPGVDEAFVATRKPLEAGQAHDFCMLLSCPRFNWGKGQADSAEYHSSRRDWSGFLPQSAFVPSEFMKTEGSNSPRSGSIARRKLHPSSCSCLWPSLLLFNPLSTTVPTLCRKDGSRDRVEVSR